MRLGLAVDTLSQLSAERIGPFDLIFIDADKQSYPDYLRWALRLSRVGALIQGIRRFNELLAAEPRVSATAIQTVGSKGYDGLAFALVVVAG